VLMMGEGGERKKVAEDGRRKKLRQCWWY
jgi:hypothetical protein